ncbi:unnamed protein product [Pylaiella littoralis]
MAQSDKSVGSRCSQNRDHKTSPSSTGEGGGIASTMNQCRHSGEGAGQRTGSWRMAGWKAAAVLGVAVLALLVADESRMPPQQQQAVAFTETNLEADAAASGGDVAEVGVAGGSGIGISASSSSSSMWDVDTSSAGRAMESLPARYRRGLLFAGNPPTRLRGAAAAPKIGQGAPPKRIPRGEAPMLNDFNKDPLDTIDLDDVQEGYIWIPVSLQKFDPSTVDPLVKMCQVNYAKYSEAPWLLPMGGLLSINSGCDDVKSDTVQIVKLSTLKRVLEEGPVPVASPTGFVFHETRCGSTLVANMLASVQTNVMWSESTGPWKVMHTCPKCRKDQIVPWLKVIMDAMSRSARHNQFYFKFQSSEDIEAVTAAYPEVPWIFIFREPVEVMMSRLGAQRIGMEGLEKEVAARVEKGMKPNLAAKQKPGKVAKETTTANQLAGLCKKAIKAFEANPGKGMMVEYTHLPDGIVTTVLPEHYEVEVSPAEKDRMMDTTRRYSKVASFAKGDTTDSKFTEDTSTKHDAASVAVQEIAQRVLYPDFYKLRSLSTWPAE